MSKGRREMTVRELIEKLQSLPPHCTVELVDIEYRGELTSVSLNLETDAVVLFGVLKSIRN